MCSRKWMVYLLILWYYYGAWEKSTTLNQDLGFTLKHCLKNIYKYHIQTFKYLPNNLWFLISMFELDFVKFKIEFNIVMRISIEHQQQLDICSLACKQVLDKHNHHFSEESTSSKRSWWLSLYLKDRKKIANFHIYFHLYVQTRWWMNTHISSLAKFRPRCMFGPPPIQRRWNLLKVLANNTRCFIGGCVKLNLHYQPQISKIRSNIEGSNLLGFGNNFGSWWMGTTSRLIDHYFLISYPERLVLITLAFYVIQAQPAILEIALARISKGTRVKILPNHLSILDEEVSFNKNYSNYFQLHLH